MFRALKSILVEVRSLNSIDNILVSLVSLVSHVSHSIDSGPSTSVALICMPSVQCLIYIVFCLFRSALCKRLRSALLIDPVDDVAARTEVIPGIRTNFFRSLLQIFFFSFFCSFHLSFPPFLHLFFCRKGQSTSAR